jgi:hypothetical protein
MSKKPNSKLYPKNLYMQQVEKHAGKNDIEHLQDRLHSSIRGHVLLGLSEALVGQSAYLAASITYTVGLACGTALGASLAATAFPVVLPAMALAFGIEAKELHRARKLERASDRLHETYNHSTPQQIKDTLQIVQKGVRDSTKLGGNNELITKDKLARVFEETLKAVQKTEEKCGKLTNKHKNALADTITHAIDCNAKKSSVIKTVKGKLFARDGHVPLKEEGYKLEPAFNKTINKFDADKDNSITGEKWKHFIASGAELRLR